MKNSDKIFIGCCEDQKVLLRSSNKIFYAVLLVLVLLLLPTVKENDRLKIKGLMEIIPYGKEELFEVRVVNDLEIDLFTYLGGALLFSLLVFFTCERDGQYLLIQDSREFFLFPIQVTYLQYFVYKPCNSLTLALCFVLLFPLPGGSVEDAELFFSLALAYVSIYFLLRSLWASPSPRKLFLLFPLSLVNIENFSSSLFYHNLQSCYLDSLIFPLLFSIILWIGLFLGKKKSFN